VTLRIKRLNVSSFLSSIAVLASIEASHIHHDPGNQALMSLVANRMVSERLAIQLRATTDLSGFKQYAAGLTFVIHAAK
jgi:hypothetical protein